MRRKMDWYYWLASAALLTAAVLLQAPLALPAAIGLTVVQLAHFAILSRGLLTFQLQVRIAYLALLLVAAWPPLRFVLWAPVVGTWAVVVADYCLLARCLSLLPWNRVTPLTWREAAATFVRPPVAGAVMQGSTRGRP